MSPRNENSSPPERKPCFHAGDSITERGTIAGVGSQPASPGAVVLLIGGGWFSRPEPEPPLQLPVDPGDEIDHPPVQEETRPHPEEQVLGRHFKGHLDVLIQELRADPDLHRPLVPGLHIELAAAAKACNLSEGAPPPAPASTTTPLPQKLAYMKKELLAELSISSTTLWRLEVLGQLRAVPGLRHKLYARAEVERFLKGENKTGWR